MNATKVAKHLSDPYNRIRYCYEFLAEDDPDLYNKAMRRIYHFLSTLEETELEETEYHY